MPKDFRRGNAGRANFRLTIMASHTTMAAMISYGLVCISELLRQKKPNMAFKTMTRTQFKKMKREDAVSELSRRIKHNIEATLETIHHCHSVGIKHYRISCKLFPLITDETLNLRVEEIVDLDFVLSKMKEVGSEAKKYGISVSCHPDQFVVIGSNDDEVCRKSIKELNFHSWVMDEMGLPQDYSSPINIHPSLSKFESPEKFIDKLIRNFFQCDIGVRQRLVFENEHHGFWTCQNLYDYFSSYMKNTYNFRFPLTLDNLHDKCNPSRNKITNEIIPYKDFFLKFYETWAGFTPVFHWSEGVGDTSNHAPSVVTPPTDFGLDVIYECEVKNKDKGFIHLLKS